MADKKTIETITLADVRTLKEDRKVRFYWTRDHRFVVDSKVYAYGHICRAGRLPQKVRVEMGDFKPQQQAV